MQSLGAYQIVRLLGEGGMGKVYEAEERLSGRRVALKVLRPELARSEPARRLFENEMQILARLDDPGVVRCLSCAEIEGELVMALELLEGRTLRQELGRRGTLEWPEAVEIVRQIASALRAAHEHEPAIVHRDLKPDNVMVAGDGTVKVTDFGIAKVLQALGGATTHSVGTLQYMSPEQIDAAPIDARSDLYSLGLVFYELLSGRPPFESSSPRELLNLQCTARPPALPESVRRGLPRGLELLLFELLEKAPADRPGSAADVLHELEPFVPAERAAARAGDDLRSRDVPRSRPALEAKTDPSRALPAGTRGREATPSSRPAIPAASPSADEATPVAAPREDTLLLLERAAAPREMSFGRALLVIAAFSALAGIATYALGAEGRAPARAVSLESGARSGP